MQISKHGILTHHENFIQTFLWFVFEILNRG